MGRHLCVGCRLYERMDEPQAIGPHSDEKGRQAPVHYSTTDKRLTHEVRPPAQWVGDARLDVARNAMYCKLREKTYARPRGSSIGPGKPLSRNGPQAGSSIVPARLERQDG